MKEDFFDSLRESINATGVSQAELSRQTGVQQGSISRFLDGSQPTLNGANVIKILSYLGGKVVFPDSTPTICKPGLPPVPIKGDDLRTINVYDVAGAGPAVALSEVEPLFSVTAPPSYFRMSDYALKVSGHSMEPLIPHGAVVGVRLGADFLANELYAARIPYEGLVIKRVGVDFMSKEFVFKSQNPDKGSYPDFRVRLNEGEEIIVGRVVWVMVGY